MIISSGINKRTSALVRPGKSGKYEDSNNCFFFISDHLLIFNLKIQQVFALNLV